MKIKEEIKDGFKLDVAKTKDVFDNDENDIVFSAHRKKIHPEKLAKVAALYDTVLVHDYCDEYHLSEEERTAKFKYYEAFKLVKKCKRKYRKLDDFVRVFRLCLDCLEVVAKTNGLYEPEKFRLLVAKGKIKVYGLHFPKYVGRDKKDINWEYINEFIGDRDRDPSELSVKKVENDFDFDDDDEIESLRRKYFTDEQYQKLFEDGESIVQEDENEDLKSVYIYGAKKIQLLTETFQELPKYIKEMKREENDRSRTRGYHLDIDEDEFQLFIDEEKRKGYYTDEMPQFKGEISNSKDYHKYLMKLKEWEESHMKVNYKGKTKTVEEVKELQLKDALEAAGWNVKALYKNKQKEKKLREKIKKEQKEEEDLKKKLVKIEERNKRRQKGDDYVNSKEKKGKKKHKKSKIHDHLNDEFEDNVLDVVDPHGEYRDYMEYAEDMGDFTFSGVFGD